MLVKITSGQYSRLTTREHHTYMQATLGWLIRPYFVDAIHWKHLNGILNLQALKDRGVCVNLGAV